MVQQLFTSDAAEITVTAPDGTTHKLVPWKRVTSDGEGQAARAKVEADRSKTEADRSGAEADRAAGIVAAAALPLPDVWAPLSDSLRLITGYGRDVLVGSDVVARMVNFSRSTTATYIGKDGQLKTAAANEPRFEKEGLLIEGQSVNIVTNSNVFTPYGTGATKVDNQPGPFGANDATRIDTVNAYTGTNQTLPSSLVDGAVYTTSVWLRGAVGGEAVRIGIHNSTVGLGVTLTTEWKRYSITQTRFAGTNSAFVIQAVNATTSFFVYGAQLEALPFASSYIPTAGAAVTRAADKAWLNVAGNLIPLSVIALEFNSIAPSSFYQAPNLTRYIVQAGDGTGITAYLGRFTTQFEDSGAAQGAIIQQGRIVVVGGVSGGKATIRSGAALSSGLAIKGFKPTELYLCNASVGSADRQAFGHVRNLRIYHRDLTADQYKAVAA
ncbi:TPA: hypothetical protein PVA50_004775 [Aeromonas hydrophila]|nr:hypothetical protein [Aeromonas hydrophila]